MVLKLRKALNGLKKAARAWSKSLELFLKKICFILSSADRSLFISMDPGVKIFILVYVDDIIIFGKDRKDMEEILRIISEQYITKREKSVEKYLGIIIENVDNGICLHRKPSISCLLENYGMEHCSISTTVLPNGFSINPDEFENHFQQNHVEKFPYRELVGSLLFLSNTTRPDISFSVSLLSRYMDKLTENLWHTAKHVLRYLKGTLTHGIIYNSAAPLPMLHGFSDASFASDIMDRSSTSGYVLLCQDLQFLGNQRNSLSQPNRLSKLSMLRYLLQFVKVYGYNS